MDIKEEDPLSEDIVSQNETDFLRNKDGVTMKTEIKSEASPKYFVKQIKFETATCSNNWEVDIKTKIEKETIDPDFGSQNEGEFLPGDPVMKLGKYNTDHEIDNKIEIQVEPWWLETESSSVCDDIKFGDLAPVTSSRLFMEAVSDVSSDKSLLSCVEVSGRHTSCYNGKNHLECGHQKSDLTGMLTAGEHFLSEQSHNYSETGEKYIKPLYLKQNSLIHKDKKLYQCNICTKEFRYLSHLKTHTWIHEAKKPHQCKSCDKSFTWLSDLKTHTMIHEGQKPHQCSICDKSFARLENLRQHDMIHEGKKPYQCKTCDKSFTQLSNLKTHNMIHEGKKIHACKTCDKSFTHLSYLKRHSLIHEGKKPHQCKSCDKNFIQLGDLNRHMFSHEGKKPHQCKTCDKSFAQLGDLNRHSAIHEGKKAHQCKICHKSFTHLSALKRHNLIHEGKKPHQCKTCDKNFTHLSALKRHTLIHEGKR